LLRHVSKSFDRVIDPVTKSLRDTILAFIEEAAGFYLMKIVVCDFVIRVRVLVRVLFRSHLGVRVVNPINFAIDLRLIGITTCEINNPSGVDVAVLQLFSSKLVDRDDMAARNPSVSHQTALAMK
jgi:hypothetical protein